MHLLPRSVTGIRYGIGEWKAANTGLSENTEANPHQFYYFPWTRLRDSHERNARLSCFQLTKEKNESKYYCDWPQGTI